MEEMAEGGLSIYISVFMLFAVCGLLFAVAVGGACGPVMLIS